MTPMRITLQILLALFIMILLPAHAQPLPSKSNGTDTSTAASKANQVALPAPSAPARELFSRYKERLVQVRVLLNSANEQSSLGSGFVVRDDGANGAWFITNYHVVSSLAINPEKYRIELRPTNERSVKATLVAVDVIHDLALLRAESVNGAAPWPVFSLRDGVQQQGEKIFSLGNPLELGFLISEGIYNGLVESRIYEQMLFSGAINSGMSGGPAIDEAGRVVGVNVSVHRMGQLISFLVPVKYVRELLGRAATAPPRKEWRSEISRQLLLHQNFVAGKLLDVVKPDASAEGVVASANAGFATQTLAGRTVPTLDGSLTKCWAGTRDGERLRYQRETLNCALHAELYVRQNFYAGSLHIEHILLRNDKLATPQFLNLDAVGKTMTTLLRLGNGEMTPAQCRDDYVKGAAHVYRIAICLKAFRKFEGLYDYTVRARQIDDEKERLTSVLSMSGVSFENAQRLSRMFLERLQ
jgi:S1-C subfamily serine protease